MAPDPSSPVAGLPAEAAADLPCTAVKQRSIRQTLPRRSRCPVIELSRVNETMTCTSAGNIACGFLIS